MQATQVMHCTSPCNCQLVALHGTHCSCCRRDGVGPGVVVNGKSVDVDAALSQEDARAMAAQQGDKHVPEDRRRLYLVGCSLYHTLYLSSSVVCWGSSSQYGSWNCL